MLWDGGDYESDMAGTKKQSGGGGIVKDPPKGRTRMTLTENESESWSWQGSKVSSFVWLHILIWIPPANAR